MPINRPVARIFFKHGLSQKVGAFAAASCYKGLLEKCVRFILLTANSQTLAVFQILL
jgi:hypothetical protein